ncbi:7350_t:CDS:2 [Paraglomus occultum]|uniref:5'-deoxynucleotidase n=1 Tax=Paraglomus occultum TaxID=144539 RepID=A0A9N9DAM3_9GLOM|nr:7350_t:CDS:2 [Paraglomus occultum]
MDSPTSKPAAILEFLHFCENLKKTKRTGWIDSKISLPESIADHMHRMAVIALLLNDPSVDKDRCVKMAVVHDLAESIVGDITPRDGITKEEKSRREQEAMQKLCKDILGETPQSQEIYDLWTEYERAETREALFVKDLDKFEMIVQAYEYERSENCDLSEFFKSTEGKFTHPLVKSWVDELYRKRNETRAD